jgi:hypothetical protein
LEVQWKENEQKDKTRIGAPERTVPIHSVLVDDAGRVYQVKTTRPVTITDEPARSTFTKRFGSNDKLFDLNQWKYSDIDEKSKPTITKNPEPGREFQIVCRNWKTDEPPQIVRSEQDAQGPEKQEGPVEEPVKFFSPSDETTSKTFWEAPAASSRRSWTLGCVQKFTTTRSELEFKDHGVSPDPDKRGASVFMPCPWAGQGVEDLETGVQIERVFAEHLLSDTRKLQTAHYGSESNVGDSESHFRDDRLWARLATIVGRPMDLKTPNESSDDHQFWRQAITSSGFATKWKMDRIDGRVDFLVHSAYDIELDEGVVRGLLRDTEKKREEEKQTLVKVVLEGGSKITKKGLRITEIKVFDNSEEQKMARPLKFNKAKTQVSYEIIYVRSAL